MKYVIYVLVLCLCLSFVKALDVDCGNGANPPCHEDDVQNVVNNIESDIHNIPKGDQGIQGVPGEQGVKGDKGDQGVPGVNGLNGEQGVPGEQGIQGIQGFNGQNGDSADVSNLSTYISSHESSWLNNGNGMNKWALGYYLNADFYFFDKGQTFKSFLDTQYCDLKEFKQVEYEVHMIKTALNLEYTPALELECAKAYGECGNTRCFANGVCIRTI